MSELITVARTDRLSVGGCKLCTIEFRRIVIINLVRGQTAAEAEASD